MRIPVTGLALFAASQVLAGEFAILANGHSMRIDRHESVGETVRLHSGAGYIEVPAGSVVRYEEEYRPAPEAPAPAEPVAGARQLVADAAKRYGLPQQFLSSVARAESGFRAEAVSPKGAVGVMQLMPATAQELGADPADLRQNVDAGARYLATLLLKYQDDPYQVRKALAAYNAGPGAVDRYQGVPPYRETVQYVERVIRQSGLAK